MNAATENELIKGLSQPQAFQHAVGGIQIIETHISWVILTGNFAYKIKKAVDFGFLDFSTLEKRRFYCNEELRLNRRFCEDLYLDVVPITGTLLHPRVNGTGNAFEYAVKMRQFEMGSLLSERAEKGLLTCEHIDGIAETIASFHQTAEVAEAETIYGNPAVIKHWNQENFKQLASLLRDDLELGQLQRLRDWSLEAWPQKAATMRRRKQQGFIRECHGDLHLGNIAIFSDKVTPFDCIEFNEELRWIDVISEIAFVFMDLDLRRLDAFAWRFLNGYLQKTGDYQGLAVLRYYLVYRALVRAKVALLGRHADSGPAEQQRVNTEYTAHLALAERYTHPPQAILLITHGFSGSGKSFHATQLAEEIGAVHLRSDIERKRLFGFEALDHTSSGVGSGIYTAEAGRKTYHQLAAMAEAVLSAGFSVIVDAAFLQAEQRAMFHALAAAQNTPISILSFKASTTVLGNRIQRRQSQQHDASEATIEILQQQIASAISLTEEESCRTILIDTEQEDAHEKLLEALLTSSHYAL
ncbi:MAG: AAA family ATPase [Nitrosomonadales bacterium]|nr:AAA family ATPase [Nitrosomonadales bacterium]